ncbi:MAG: enoyl-CoA hydratase-related protein, partial [Haliea sp.]
MNTEPVITAIDARGVATVTIDNPDKHNAFDDEIIARLRLAFDTLAERKDVRVVVL